MVVAMRPVVWRRLQRLRRGQVLQAGAVGLLLAVAGGVVGWCAVLRASRGIHRTRVVDSTDSVCDSDLIVWIDADTIIPFSSRLGAFCSMESVLHGVVGATGQHPSNLQ